MSQDSTTSTHRGLNDADPEMRKTDDLKPYPNNPREIPEEAVSRVAESIELFGWQQPIVVDEHDVVVVGHTRLQAAKRLGFEEVPVHVTRGLSEEEVREYRLVDNRTGEMSEWDSQALSTELREFDDDLVESFFPDADLEISTVEGANREPTDIEIEKAAEQAQTIKPVDENTTHTTEVVCPKCYQDFQVRTKSLPGVDDALIRSLTNGETE